MTVEHEGQSSYAARNTGIEAAKGDILCFVDADMWVEDTYVASVKQAMEERDCSYIGCNVEIEADED